MTFWAKAEVFSPVFCRLLAQEDCRPLHETRIAARCGNAISPLRVEVMSSSTSWNGVPLDMMRDYLTGCGTDFTDAKTFRRLSDYLSRKPNFAYLRRDPRYKELYLPLLLIWLRSAVNNPPEWKPLRELVDRLRPLLKTK